MYHYVEDKNFIKKAQKKCSEIIKDLEVSLRENEDINTQFFLIGSGARNMVTQNGNKPIDFDYNLNIISCENINNCKGIKETVRIAFNKVLESYELSDCDDSTSSLTTKPLYLEDDQDIKFSIDLCIVTKDENDKWYRLKHKKTGNSYNDQYFWNEAPSSNNVKKKANEIKKINKWLDVRDTYLNKKNMYMSRNDRDHPSFICYIEAVNEVYNKLK